MKFLLALLVLPGIALAQNKLPNPKKGEEICYSRVYSYQHLMKNPTQEITASVVTLNRDAQNNFLSSTIYVVNKKGTILFNAGSLLKSNGMDIAVLPAQEVAAQMDGDSGRYGISQDAKNVDQVKIKVKDFLSLIDIHSWIFDDSIPEGTDYERMTIDGKSSDSEIVLKRNSSVSKTPGSCLKYLKSTI